MIKCKNAWYENSYETHAWFVSFGHAACIFTHI